MFNEGSEILRHDLQNEGTNANCEDVEQGSFGARKESEDFSKTAGDTKAIQDTLNNIDKGRNGGVEIFLQGKQLQGKQRDQFGVVKANREDEEQGFVVTTEEDLSKTASGTTDTYSEDAKSYKRGLTLTERDDLAMASLILGMERTLFAALNNAWLLAIGGVGLMSVGHGDDRATHGGIFILSISAVCAGVAYAMHVWRISQIRASMPFQTSHTIIWATMIAALTIVTLGLELYFGIFYPYLNREKAVTIAGMPEGML